MLCCVVLCCVVFMLCCVELCCEVESCCVVLSCVALGWIGFGSGVRGQGGGCRGVSMTPRP